MIRLRDRIGRRGAALLFFSLVYLVYSYGLVNPPRPLTETYRWPVQVMPLWAWAVLWLTAGLAALGYAFARGDTPGYTVAMVPPVAWGLLFVIGQASGAVQRGYISGAIWLGFAAFVFLIAGGIPPPVPVVRKGRVWIRS